MEHAEHRRWTPELVEDRLLEAGRTLMRIEVRNIRPAGIRTHWPDVVHSFMDAYGRTEAQARTAAATPDQIARMDEAFSWLPLIPSDMIQARRVVAMRALNHPDTCRLVYSYRRIGQLLNCSDHTVKTWYLNGIGRITSGLIKNSTSQTAHF